MIFFMIASFVFLIYLTLKIVEILADRRGVYVSFRIVEKIDALILSIFSKNTINQKAQKNIQITRNQVIKKEVETIFININLIKA